MSSSRSAVRSVASIPSACADSRQGIITLSLLFTALLVTGPPLAAQLADVPIPDGEGNFRTSRIAGMRGDYQQRQWLVVERDPQGLNCRDGKGRIPVALRYGSVIDSDLRQDPIEAVTIERGLPWLRVIVNPADLLRDHRPPASRNRPLSCLVRARADLIAPINPDSLETPGPGPPA